MVVYHYLRGFLISDLSTHLLHHLALARRASRLSLLLHDLLAVVVVVEVVHHLLVLLDLVHALARFAPLCFQLFALGLALGSNFGDDQHLLFSRSVLGNLLLRLLFLLLEVLPLGVSGGLVHFSKVFVLGTLRTTVLDVLHSLVPRTLLLEGHAVLLRMPCIVFRRVGVTSAHFSLVSLRIRISL